MRRLLVVILGLVAVHLTASWLVPAGAAEEEAVDNSKALGYLPPGGVMLTQLPTDVASDRFRTLDARLAKRLLGFRVEPFSQRALS